MKAAPRFQLLLTTGALFRPVEQVTQVEDEDLPVEEVTIDDEDMRDMRANVETMQLQMRDGLRNIQELRELLTQMAAPHQRERSVGQQQASNAFVPGTT
ncbi:hypothetical protein BBJ28_00000720 [Nothophytophthora sp. Chile5]|nr:hypothetical protein BBJ28_00000720 [Nothophytophthora sp. Chile5]